MDPSIWGRLPDELLERVLSLLPLRTIVALRPTCKRFNSLLNTPSFLTIFRSAAATTTTTSSFLVLSHPQFSPHVLPFYDSSADAWRAVPLLGTSSSLVSSSHGLLLFSLGPASLLVSNPLTNSSSTLTCPTQHPSTALIVSPPSPSPHGYSVFLPCPNSASVFLYSSTSLSWSRFPGGPPSVENGTPFRGSLYFTTPEPFSVVAFDLDTGKWGRGAVPDLPDELAFVRLVSGNERLFLIGGIGRDGISRSVAAWEMRDEEGWVEVGRVPELMCRKFVSVCYHNYAHVYCVWQEGTLCVCCTTWPEVLFLRVGRGTWHWLPRCPLLQEKWSCGFRWFSFAPDLYALV